MNPGKLIREGDYEKALWELANVIEHDAHCWEEVLKRVDDNEYLRAWSQDRINCLHIECDRVYEAILDIRKERQKKETAQPLKHKPDNHDYTKRQHRRGHGWKANHQN